MINHNRGIISYIGYHITSSFIISYHIILYHIILHHIISYHIISREHIFFCNKKTSSMTIYSSPTTRHLLLPQQDIFFSHKKTSSSLRRRHSMSPDLTYRLQTHHLGSIQGTDLKNLRLWQRRYDLDSVGLILKDMGRYWRRCDKSDPIKAFR